MGRVIIINGSPRAPRSNSKEYGEIFSSYYKGQANTFNITKNNHKEICSKIGEYTDILFVFPLYADGLPVTMLNFLKVLEENPPKNKPKVNVIINCGFIEPEQNNVCIDMVKLFCKQNTYEFNSVLSIGGGEAILGTPFKIFVKWKIKKLAKSIYNNIPENLSVTMPISKNMYLKASTNYWINYGKRNGITKSQMETMKIE
ncbi:hypothetical protein ACSW9O_09570 [Clostridium perfringens]|uniref:hypothetical protein n=1 Tax=Clostridium perfringens TaxID=1502 RepID=UPI0013E2D861|nr:hypothetical protein [Clostridium perfringens]MCX0410965.1 hypothetical protein [Clostridium perfringens]NGT83199.1 hypothetical protein [Clostridium perfringens]BDA33837.1 hypothetical protein CPBEC5_08450 [Clostridium perfringens]HAT4348706.1 hypothetical protein [Clostridium perfringens]HCG3018383.1 hypothetical protein [Clostridium perfringens]